MFSNTFAKNIASHLIELIAADCERVEIVGSLRREKSSVNDIDIIAIPRYQIIKDDTLFGEPVRVNLLDRNLSARCLELYLNLELNGAKIKRFFREINGVKVPIDLYIATEATWWTLLLLRTGSREHNIKLAMRAQGLHMHLKADGSGLLSPGGSLLPVSREEDIFKHLQMPFKKPEERDC